MTAAGGAAPLSAHTAGEKAASECSQEELLVNALEYMRAGHLAEAEAAYAAVLGRGPHDALCLHHLGLLAHRRGNHAQAARLLEEALALRPDYVEVLSNLSAVRRTLGETGAALAAARQAVLLAPEFAQAHSNLGNALEDQGRLEDALAAYRRAVSLNPGFAEASINCANVLRRLGRADEALKVCEEIIAKRPDAAEAHFSLGNVLKELNSVDQAIEAYRRAIALRPDFPEAFVNLGNALQNKEAFGEALAAYRSAVEIRPGIAGMHVNMGTALENLGRLDEAIVCYRAALALNPDLLAVRVWLHHKRREICDWRGIESEEKELCGLMAQPQKDLVHPFPPLSMAASASEHLEVAKTFAATFRAPSYEHERPRTPERKKLRIGYLSGDFCRHATAILTAELFERHDRSSFELVAYSHGPEDRSEIGRRMRQAFDSFADIRSLRDEEAAARIKNDAIDILIELKGYTKGARTGIAARRPAPIQVSFLGFPGTMGAPFIDYIIADPFILPLDQQPFYNEKIVHLPHSYQPNDTKRLIADVTPTRAECGLPGQGFVFCSFNNSYKITPQFFSIWMRLLNEIPDAVLWLLDANALVKDNLRRAAAARGVDPDRLVFARKLPSPEHLARHRLADLFLDTLPYNAHTTASDALWAGLPVLTCAGNTFAGRVAGSLLHAAGLPELVTHSPADYEALALRLARERPHLQRLRQKLLDNRLSAPLFDIAQYTRDYEAALTHMWEIWANGEPARAFAVPASGALEHEAVRPSISRIKYGACPLCGSTGIPPIIGADCSKHPVYQPALPAVIHWHQCNCCGHVFTDGYFDAAAAELIFAKTQPCQAVGYDMERQRPVSARIVERAARHAPGGCWLDVGFGNGSLLFAAEEWGYTPVGLDLRKENVRTLTRLGYESYCLSIEELDQSGRFSVISMADVLEHMPFPRAGLGAAHRLLRPGGVLFLSMPNMDNMTWRLLHANGVNPYWGEIEHYHNFSRKRLYALLQAEGFRPVEYSVSERYRVCMEVIALKEQ